MGQGVLLCGGYLHQLTAREKGEGCGEEPASERGSQREIPEKPRKYFENGDPTQRGKCSMTPP